MEKEKISKFELFKKNMKTFINDYVLTLTLSEAPAVFILLLLGLIMGFPAIILLFGLSIVLIADIIALAIGSILSVIKTKNVKEKLNKILSDNTNQPLEKIYEDTERDNFLSAKEAKDYGLIDDIIKKNEF